nr:LysR family transcriptional regulator [Paracoccaceae bacterium]
MDLATLQLLLDVARAGGFAPAARVHNVDPSSVSRAVAQAETALGVRLFQRSTRRLTLTEAGEVYLRRLEPALEEITQASEAARAASGAEALTGRLRLAASVAFGQAMLTPLLPEWRAAHPGLTMELALSDAVTDLVAEQIDLAIRLGPGVSGDVVAAKLFATRYRVCAAPSYLTGAPQLATPKDLMAHDCLRFALPGFRAAWLFRAGDRREETVAVDGKLLISNALALREAAVQGLGPALLAEWLIAEDLAAGRLVDALP